MAVSGVRQEQLAGGTNVGTIQTLVATLPNVFPNEIGKAGRGVYVKLEATPPQEPPPPAPEHRAEESLYEPFAAWLKNDVEEVTESTPLGGAMMGKKWATPDVIGVYRPPAGSVIRFQPEIVAAEIKINPYEAITAFGQAVAYRLFAAKSYIVMPNSMPGEESSRLESLSLLFGIGFVLFDPNSEVPDFEIRVRAQRFLPDMYYVNEFADRLRSDDPGKFGLLFG